MPDREEVLQRFPAPEFVYKVQYLNRYEVYENAEAVWGDGMVVAPHYLTEDEANGVAMNLAEANLVSTQVVRVRV